MKTGSVRDLRNNFAKLEAWLEEAEQIQIEAGTMLQQLQSDVAAGVLEIVPTDWPDVHRPAPWSGGVPHV
jgi:hypothetical protein